MTLRVLATLLLALVAALACLALHTPLPWMIGPLLAVSLASIAGAPTASYTPLRNAGQWAIGMALGLYFTPQMAGLLAERAGARTDLVAAAHSLRLVLVTLVIPFAMRWLGLHGLGRHRREGASAGGVGGDGFPGMPAGGGVADRGADVRLVG